MSITLSLNMIAWISLALFWVILMCWPYRIKRYYGYLGGVGEAVEGMWKLAFRVVFGLLFTVVFLWAKLIIG